MALNGDLGDLSLPDLFYIIQVRQLSGRLLLQNHRDTITLFFKHGKLTYITSSASPQQLGQLAVRTGKVTVPQLGQALAVQALEEEHLPLGQILITNGWLSADDLGDLLVKQSEAILYQALAWSQAAFSFTPAVTPPLQMPLGNVNVEQIILEATRRADEKAARQASAATTHQAEAATANQATAPPSDTRSTFGLDDQTILVDAPQVRHITTTLALQARIVIASIREGATTLRQVIAATGLDRSEVLQIARVLQENGVLLPAPSLETPAAVAMPEAVAMPATQAARTPDRRGGLLAPHRHAPISVTRIRSSPSTIASAGH